MNIKWCTKKRPRYKRVLDQDIKEWDQNTMRYKATRESNDTLDITLLLILFDRYRYSMYPTHKIMSYHWVHGRGK